VQKDTSLEKTVLNEGRLEFAGTPVYVVHANNCYDLREDGRRVFQPEGARAMQDHFEREFERYRREWRVK
jgi:hypothetical protein